VSTKLLLIENDESCIEEVKKVLQDDSNDFEIDLAPTLNKGLEKLEYCAGHDDPIYDVILLDLTLPNGKGFEVFSKVSKKCKRLPIVIISRFESEAIQCVQNGAQDYILRPIHMITLPKSLRYAIERFNLDRRYYQLVESTHAAIYEIDFINQKFTYVNDKVCEYTGYSRMELLSMSPFDILTEESRLVFKERLEKLSKGEFINNVEEFQVIRKDGKKRWAMITADYIVKENITVGARVVALDVTSKKNKQQLIQSIFNTSPVALGILDYANGERIITQVNDFMCSMLGYTKNELVGYSAILIYPSKDEFDRVGRIKYKEIFKGKRGTLETQWKKKNGEIIDVLLSTAPLDPKDPHAYSTFTALDITDEKKQTRYLNNELYERVTKWQNEKRIQTISDNQIHLLNGIIAGT